MQPRQPSPDILETNRAMYESNSDRNIFVIMRYGTDAIYGVVENAIKDTAGSYGFNASLAKDILFYTELWRNVEFFMQHSRYGIVVFDRSMQPEFNPNVSVELGYMLGLGRYCLLLKEQSVFALHTDIVSYLYEPFDFSHPRKTVSKAVEGWLEKLGHQKIKSTEIITSENVIEAKKNRTERLLITLEQMRTAKNRCVLRQAGSLSSLAISEDEVLLGREDPKLKELLLRERKAFEELIESGLVVRCLISPFVQIVSLQLKILSSEYVKLDVVPRFKQLSRLLDLNLHRNNLQIACTARLPHDNILIDEGGCLVFVGKRRLKQWGFPHTTIYHDPNLVRTEADRFDSAFHDAAAACLERSEIAPEDYGSPELKRTVIRYLDDCRKQLETMM